MNTHTEITPETGEVVEELLEGGLKIIHQRQRAAFALCKGEGA